MSDYKHPEVLVSTHWVAQNLNTPGLRPVEVDVDTTAYGERSSHTWFVLKYLLGYKEVRNYDGSWTEWGNLVGAPIDNPHAVSPVPVAVCQSA